MCVEYPPTFGVISHARALPEEKNVNISPNSFVVMPLPSPLHSLGGKQRVLEVLTQGIQSSQIQLRAHKNIFTGDGMREEIITAVLL